MTEPVPPQALSPVALSSSICNSGDSMNEDKLTIDLRNGRRACSPFFLIDGFAAGGTNCNASTCRP